MVSRHNIPCEFIPGFAWLLISKMYVKMGSKSSDNHPQNDITLFYLVAVHDAIPA